MKTKAIVWILAIMMVMPTQGFAQDDASKKKSKKTEKAAAIVGGAVLGGVLIGSLLKKKKKNKEEETSTEEVQAGTTTYVTEPDEFVGDVNEEGVEVAVVGEELQRRPGAFKLVTNHPDFKIKVRRCEASGKTCVIDMIIENVGASDVSMLVLSNQLIAYDDEANQYNQIRVSVGNANWIGIINNDRTLMADVPMKARIQIEGVAESATMFRRLDWGIRCDAWGLNESKPIKFINLPISREGDE